MSKKSFIDQAEETLTLPSETRLPEEQGSNRNVVLNTQRLSEARRVPLSDIDFDPNQPRDEIDENDEEFLGFIDSIAKNGLMQALVVEFRPDTKRYLLVVGERRLRAVRKLGWADVPCIVRENISESERYTLQMIENIQRKNFTPIQTARGLLELKKRLGPEATWVDVEKMTGINERRRKQFSALLKLPEDIQHHIVGVGRRPSNNKVTEKHGRALLVLNKHPDKQTKLLAMIQNGKTSLSGDEAMDAAKKMLGRAKRIYKFSITYTNRRDLLEKLEGEVKNLRKQMRK